jgi:sec-independent protein translocase protein TatB
MSLSHMIILGIIALIVIPPEKLPEMARELAKFIFEIKRSADQVFGDLKREAMIKPEDILDQNIKDKLAEIQRGLNQPINLESLTTKPQSTTHNDVASEVKVTEAQEAKPKEPTSTDPNPKKPS